MRSEPDTVRCSSVTPCLYVDGVRAAIAFYGKVFGAGGQLRPASPDGRADRAGILLGAALVMVCGEDHERGLRGPKAIGGSPVTLDVQVDDVDAVFARALEAGATVLRPVEDRGPGERGGQFEDPFGHRWSVATHAGRLPVVTACRSPDAIKGAAGQPPP